MSKLNVSTKSVSDWGETELKYLRIKIQTVHDFITFFQCEPPDLVDDCLYISHYNINFSTLSQENKQVQRFVKSLHHATITHTNNENNVDAFAQYILQLFDYDEGNKVIGMRLELPLHMCGTKVYAKPDIYVEDLSTEIKLLVQEDKSYNTTISVGYDLIEIEAQMVSNAIASFQANNSKFYSKDLPMQSHKLMPCIVMLGTYPIFYLFEITIELSDNIKYGIYPEVDTIIKRYQPVKSQQREQTLYDIDKRIKIFQCYQAFRKFVQ